MNHETTETTAPARHRRRADSVAATTEWIARLRDDPDSLDAFVAAWSADVKVVAELVINHARVSRGQWLDEAHQIALIELWDLGREIVEKNVDVTSIGGTLYRRATLQFRRFHRSTAGAERVSGVVAWRRRDADRIRVVTELAETLDRRPNTDEIVAESRRRFADREQVVADLTETLGRRPSSTESATECHERFGHGGLVRPFQPEEVNFLPALSLDRPVSADTDATFADQVTAVSDGTGTMGDPDPHGQGDLVNAMRVAVIGTFDEPEATVARMFFDDSGATTAADAADVARIGLDRARRTLRTVRERARQWWSEESEKRESPGTNAGAFT